jgi:transposase
MAKMGRRATKEEREQAIRLFSAGRSVEEVVEMTGFARRTVFEWLAKYRKSGSSGLETKPTAGPSTALTDRQMQELRAIIIGTNPTHFGFRTQLWTRGIIGHVIHERFSVSLSRPTVGRVMARLGLSPQRPLYRAYQQDAAKVEEWKEETYPQIRKDAAEQGASIFFADEASIRANFHSGTTWAPIGCTPVVESTGDRNSIMMVSAISPRGELRFHIHEGSFKAADFIDFCKQLISTIETNIFLIVDGSTVHTAKAVKDFVATTDGRLSIFFLPPYSPQLNPDEWVWKNVKCDQIGRRAIRGKGDLKLFATGALRHLQKSPAKVRGFFGDSHLAYIGQ